MSDTTVVQQPEVSYMGMREMANRRRLALTDVGCSTYILGAKPGQNNILCVCCGMMSYNENDIKNLYCGYCHEFHAGWK